MRRIRILTDKIWDKISVLCGVLIVMLPISPLIMPTLKRDSGVFFYIGWRILHGELPYRDIWDHKPPLIFYLNALGLGVSNNSLWGVWLIECLLLFLAAFIGFQLIRKAWGSLPAVFSLFFWLFTLTFLITGGNLTEEYALSLQFAALLLITNADKPNFRNWQVFLIGLLGAIAFFTKQTTVGIWMAILIYLTLQRLTTSQVKRWLREVFIIFCGAAPIFIGIVISFGSQGALPQLWSAAFKYNLIYSSSADMLAKLKYIAASGLTTLAQIHTGIFYFAIIGYFAGIILIFYKRTVIGYWLALLIIGLLDLPIELILVGLSGRNYAHYYITLLPVLTVFVGFMFWMLQSQLSTWGVPNQARFILMFGIVGLIIWSSFSAYHLSVVVEAREQDPFIISYIDSSTSPNDYVLLWGAESSYNYLAQRRSPTRFVYQYPLYQIDYTNEQLIEEFLEGVIQNRPKLIIDTQNVMTPMYDFPIQTPTINADIAYLKSHYRPVDNLGAWKVYSYTENGIGP
jgi:hypothetical protein